MANITIASQKESRQKISSKQGDTGKSDRTKKHEVKIFNDTLIQVIVEQKQISSSKEEIKTRNETQSRIITPEIKVPKVSGVSAVNMSARDAVNSEAKVQVATSPKQARSVAAANNLGHAPASSSEIANTTGQNDAKGSINYSSISNGIESVTPASKYQDPVQGAATQASTIQNDVSGSSKALVDNSSTKNIGITISPGAAQPINRESSIDIAAIASPQLNTVKTQVAEKQIAQEVEPSVVHRGNGILKLDQRNVELKSTGGYGRKTTNQAQVLQVTGTQPMVAQKTFGSVFSNREVSNTAADSVHFKDQLAQSVLQQIDKGDGNYQVNVKMQPEALGTVSAKITLLGSQLHVIITPNTTEAHSVLASSLAEIEKLLSHDGMRAQVSLGHPSQHSQNYQGQNDKNSSNGVLQQSIGPQNEKRGLEELPDVSSTTGVHLIL